MRARWFVLLFVFTLFMFSGCVEKTESFYQHQAKISDVKVADQNGDGIPDQWYFEFEPFTNDKGVVLRRNVLVEGISRNISFEPNLEYSLDPAYNETLSSLLIKGENLSFECSYSLDQVFPCGSESECQATCLSNPRCKNAMNKYSDLKGSFYETTSIYYSVRNKSRELRDLVYSQSRYSSQDYQQILNKRDELLSSISRLMNTPVYKNMLCNPSDIMSLQGLLTNMEDIFVEHRDLHDPSYYYAFDEYKITNVLTISYSNDGLMDITDIVPKSLADSPSLVEFKTLPQSVSPTAPVNAKFRVEFRKRSVETVDLAYVIKSSSKNWNSVLSQYSYPYGEITFVDWSKLEFVDDMKSMFYGTYSTTSSLLGNRSYGLAVAVFAMLMLLYVLQILVKSIFALFDTLSKREALREVLYKLAGTSAGNRTELIVVSLLAIAGGWYLSQGINPPDTEVISFMLKNSSLLGSVLLFNVGFFSLYFLISDLVKGAILGDRYYMSKSTESVHKLILEKDLKNELTQMRKDIITLRDLLIEQGMNIHENIDDFILHVSKADNLISQGKINDAQRLVDSKIRTEYLRLREKLASYKNQLKEVQKLTDEIHDEIDQLEALKSKAIKLNISYNPREWLVEMDKYKEYVSKGDYKGATEYLESLYNEVRKARMDLSENVSKYEVLIKTKFPCPVCGHLTSLAYPTCEHCGVPLAEGFNSKLSSLEDQLHSYKEKIALHQSPNLNTMYDSVNVLLDHLREYINEKKYAKASQLISTIEEKMHHLNDVLSALENQEKELEVSLSNVETLLQTLPVLIDDGKSAGLDMSQFEQRFSSLKSSFDELQQSDLPISDLFTRIHELDESLTQLEHDVKNYSARFQSSLKSLDRINDLFTTISTLITKAEGLGLDVSEYVRRLERINVDALADGVERNEVSSDDLAQSLNTLSELESELRSKVKLASQIRSQLDKLSSLYSSANQLLELCVSKGIHPFEESLALQSINLDSLRDELKYLSPESAQRLMELINSNISKVNDISSKLKLKLAAVDAWPNWKSYIQNLLSRLDEIGPSMLSEIPPEWRSWAMERFVSETTLPVTLKDNKIVRLKDVSTVSKSDLDNILSGLVASAKIKGAAIVRRDGLVISSNLPEGMASDKLGALSAAAMRDAQKAFDAMDKGTVNYVVINAKEAKLVVGSAGDQALLSVVVSPEEDLGFISVTLKNAGRRVKNLLSKL